MAKHLKIREDVTMSDEDTGNEEGPCLSEGSTMKRRRSSSPSFLPSSLPSSCAPSRFLSMCCLCALRSYLISPFHLSGIGTLPRRTLAIMRAPVRRPRW